MKHENVNYLVVGTFVLSVLVGLLVVLALIAGRTGATDDYHTVYDNVTGLDVGTAVSYEGFAIGQVEDISPIHVDGRTRYRVNFGVIRQADGTPWPIPDDSTARIVSAGLLSAVTIDIKEGKSNSYYAPGAEIAGGAQPDLFLALADAADSIDTLATNTLQPLINDIGASLRTVASQAELKVPQILQDLESITGRLDDSAAQLNNLLNADNRERVEAIFRHLNESLSRMDDLLNESSGMVADNKPKISQAVEELRQSVHTMSQYVGEITLNLESASRNMDEMSRQLRENPSLIIRSKPPQDDLNGQN
jgi:phospholipid/cholesterol/gamma-HCH transport system substrate-binding protein